MAGYGSGRGGYRPGSGRPKVEQPSTKVLRVPHNVNKQEIEAIPSLRVLLAYWSERVKENLDNPRYYYLNQFLQDIKEIGLEPNRTDK